MITPSWSRFFFRTNNTTTVDVAYELYSDLIVIQAQLKLSQQSQTLLIRLLYKLGRILAFRRLFVYNFQSYTTK